MVSLCQETLCRFVVGRTHRMYPRERGGGERFRREASVAPYDGFLGRAAVLHRRGAGATVDRGGGAQRALVNQFVDLGGRAVFCPDGFRGGGTFDAISGRRRAVRLDENGVR